MTEEVQDTASAVKQFPCPRCGATLEFKPGVMAMTCEYCGAERRIPQSEEEVEELDFHAFLQEAAGQADEEERQTVACERCGATITLDANITATNCPFCASPLVAQSSTTRLIRPKSLLPFHVSQAEALKAFRAWIRGRWFAPNDLKRFCREETNLRGLYVPYWTYDTDALTFYRGERGDDYWETQHYTTTVNGKTQHKTRRVRKTRWRSVSGSVWNRFDDILVLASRSLPTKYAEQLEPWDLKNLEPYGDEFLSGFTAESYQVDLATGFEQAQEIIYPTIERTIRDDIGGDHQRIHSTRIQYSDITFKHILLPMWLSVYDYKQTTYRFLVNARTGEVQGERPWSWIKILLTVLAGIAAVVILYLLSNT